MTREGDETPLEQLYANFYPQTTENENNQENNANSDDEGDNNDPTALPDLSNEDEQNNAAYTAARSFFEAIINRTVNRCHVIQHSILAGRHSRGQTTPTKRSRCSLTAKQSPQHGHKYTKAGSSNTNQNDHIFAHSC